MLNIRVLAIKVRRQTLRRFDWQRRLKMVSAVSITLLIVFASLHRAAIRGDESTFLFGSAKTCRVVQIVDGQSVQIASGHVVRLIGIDRAFGRVRGLHERGLSEFDAQADAREYLQRHAVGQNFSLEFDRQRIDVDNAILAWLFQGDDCLNVTLVERGLAAVDFSRPLRPDLKKQLKDAEAIARAENRGRWSKLNEFAGDE